MLVDSSVVSSHEFSFSFYFVLDIYTKITKIISSIFPTSSCFHRTLLFLFFVFFSLHSLKHKRTVNTHVNNSVKFLSPPVPVDLTRLVSML